MSRPKERLVTNRIARLALAVPLVLAVAAVAPGVAHADDLGDDEIVVSGLKQGDVTSRCKVKFLAKSDGEWKKSSVWIASIGKGLYVLSSKSGWYERALADRDVILRVGDDDFAVSARPVEDDAQRAAVHEALKEKCGFFWYKVRSFFTMGRSNKVMKIVPRPRGH
jgi:hypothetical protein